MMKTVVLRLVLLPGVVLLAAAFLLAPQTAFASTTQSQLGQRPYAVSSCPGLDPCKAAYPRLSLSGCSGQDGFNGYVQWSDANVPGSGYIQIWGQVWDICGTTANVYLSYHAPGYQNPQAGQAPSFETVGVNQTYNTSLNAGHIAVTVCAWWGGQWTCGTPYSL